MDRLDAMRAFAAVADRGSFAEAARYLRLSPAAVTRAVAQLEGELGLVLLQRTTRSVRLTERGAVYLDACKQVFADVERGERLARGEDAEPRGALTVAAPLLFGRLHVLPIVEALLAAHPALSIRLMLSDRVVHLVEEGIDVAVRIAALADSALIAIKLGEVQRVLVASPDYLAARGSPQTPAALAQHDVIAFEGMDATNDWRFGPAGKTTVRVDPRLAVNSADAAIAAAEAGFGITRALSYQVRESVEKGRLRLVLHHAAPPAVPISVVHPARRFGATNLAAFVAAARNYFRAHPVMPLEEGTARSPAKKPASGIAKPRRKSP
jgi:DNA-binding transcriptional LysR family regulator